MTGRARFSAGRNMAMKVPSHQYEATVRFYRDVRSASGAVAGQAGAGKLVTLSPFARELLVPSLRDLTETDRLAGDTPVRALAVQPRSVQIVMGCLADALHQRVGRLKRRSATLLSFDPLTGIAGEGTWSKGFWWARLEDEALVSAVEAFVARIDT